jgi:hypothetical protein
MWRPLSIDQPFDSNTMCERHLNILRQKRRGTFARAG